MKTCPVCDAKSFDDMEICFSCMHRFSEPIEADFVQKSETALDSLETSFSVLPVFDVAQSATVAQVDSESEVSVKPQAAAVLPVMESGYNLVISLQPA